jgi:GMP synthase (glutamine-hydrolysing)
LRAEIQKLVTTGVFLFCRGGCGHSSFARSPGARQSAFVNALSLDWEASGVRLPYELLARIFNRIVNDLKRVNRVVLNIYTKPRSTIERE